MAQMRFFLGKHTYHPISGWCLSPGRGHLKKLEDTLKKLRRRLEWFWKFPHGTIASLYCLRWYIDEEVTFRN